MRVNVIISVEREIEVDDKFQVMDLPECDDGWDEIPDSLSKELLKVAEKSCFSLYPELEIFEVEEIYSTENCETMYKRDRV